MISISLKYLLTCARHGQRMELKAVPIDMCKTWIGTRLWYLLSRARRGQEFEWWFRIMLIQHVNWFCHGYDYDWFQLWYDWYVTMTMNMIWIWLWHDIDNSWYDHDIYMMIMVCMLGLNTCYVHEWSSLYIYN